MEWIDSDVNADGTRRLVTINKDGVSAKVLTISQIDNTDTNIAKTDIKVAKTLIGDKLPLSVST